MEICTHAWNCRSRCAGRSPANWRHSAKRPRGTPMPPAPSQSARCGIEPGPKATSTYGIELEDPLALRLRVAAAHGDHALGVGLLQCGRLREMRREALIGLLAHRARVEDDDVGLLRGDRLAEAERLEHPLDPLRVVGVHLTPECGDVVAPHRSNCTGVVNGLVPRGHGVYDRPVRLNPGGFPNGYESHRAEKAFPSGFPDDRPDRPARLLTRERASSTDRAVLLRVHRRNEQQQGAGDLQRHRRAHRPCGERLRDPDVLQWQPGCRPDHRPHGHGGVRRRLRGGAERRQPGDPRPGRPDERRGLVQRRRRSPAPQGRDGDRFDRSARLRPGDGMGHRPHQHGGQHVAPQGGHRGRRSGSERRFRSRGPVGRLRHRRLHRPRCAHRLDGRGPAGLLHDADRRRDRCRRQRGHHGDLQRARDRRAVRGSRSRARPAAHTRPPRVEGRSRSR